VRLGLNHRDSAKCQLRRESLQIRHAHKRINPRLIKLHRSYAVEEIARILGAHKNTVRGWIKSGLPVVDKSRPVLMHGRDLRSFLEKRRKNAKRPYLPGTLYCFKCRQPMPPALGMVEYVAMNDIIGNLIALCGGCDTVMHRRTRFNTIAAIMPNLDVQIREAQPRLIERTPASLNCDKPKD
jgi:hypothetical protein